MSIVRTLSLINNKDVIPSAVSLEGVNNVHPTGIKTPDDIVTRMDAINHWKHTRSIYEGIAKDLLAKLNKGAHSENRDTVMVSVLAAKIIDCVSKGMGSAVFTGIHEHRLTGIHLEMEAIKDIAMWITLRVPSMNDNDMLKYINTSRSMLTEFCVGKPMVGVAWVMGNIQMPVSSGRYIYGTDLVLYSIKSNSVLGIVSNHAKGGYWKVPSKYTDQGVV